MLKKLATLLTLGAFISTTPGMCAGSGGKLPPKQKSEDGYYASFSAPTAPAQNSAKDGYYESLNNKTQSSSNQSGKEKQPGYYGDVGGHPECATEPKGGGYYTSMGFPDASAERRVMRVAASKPDKTQRKPAVVAAAKAKQTREVAHTQALPRKESIAARVSKDRSQNRPAIAKLEKSSIKREKSKPLAETAAVLQPGGGNSAMAFVAAIAARYQAEHEAQARKKHQKPERPKQECVKPERAKPDPAKTEVAQEKPKEKGTKPILAKAEKKQRATKYVMATEKPGGKKNTAQEKQAGSKHELAVEKNVKAPKIAQKPVPNTSGQAKASVKLSRGAIARMENNHTIVLDSGDALIEATHGITVKMGDMVTDINQDTIAYITNRDGCRKIRNMFDRKAGTLTATIDNHNFVVHVGQELVIAADSASLNDAVAEDGIERRALRTFELADGKEVLTAEYSPVSLMHREDLLKSLPKCATVRDKTIFNKVVKMAACLQIATASHGMYAPVTK